MSALHPMFMRRLRKMGATDVLVGDCGGNIVVSNHAFETKYGQRNLTNNGNSPMGFSLREQWAPGLPIQRDKWSATIGDGGFNMNPQELQTFVNYGVKVKTFILNNHIYGITKAYQETNFQGRAEACGPKGYHPPISSRSSRPMASRPSPSNHAEMDAKIDEVLQFDGPVCCDVDMHEFHTYEPKSSVGRRPSRICILSASRRNSAPTWSSEPAEGWMVPVSRCGAPDGSVTAVVAWSDTMWRPGW